jgi:hypothetical protein
MRRFAIYGLIGVLVAGSTACGGKTEDAKQPAAAAEEAARAVAKGGDAEVAKGMQEFAKAMEQMQQSPDGTTYEPVSFKALQGFFPDMPGWEKEAPTGETMTSPVRFSQAESAYTKDDARIEIKIVDTAMSKMLTMPYQMFLMSGYQKETDTGYEKAAKVGGIPGWEKWDSVAKRAELGAIVGQRFIVTLEGSETDVKTVQGFAAKVDFGKLAGLK